MDAETFCRLREIVYENSGIYLNETKEAMVLSRLAKRMRQLNIHEPVSYLEYINSDKTGNEIIQLLDVISTNVTSYYRECEHFDFLAEKVLHWTKLGRRRIRIWCAAAATGEEAYSIAMTSINAAHDMDADIKILATDISTRALSKAQNGSYQADLMNNVPRSYKEKYFMQTHDSNQVFYTARPSLKNIIIFRRLNLFKPPFPMKGPLDIVFCRNVMIYFSQQVRTALISEIYRLLGTDGYLITGHAESLTGVKSSFKCVTPSIYQK